MSAFLDEVFAAQEARHRLPRRSGEGLSGSGKRFATLLTLMVGLTAVPTFIMVRAGVDELRASSAAPVRPILLVVPDKAPPPNKEPLVIEPQQSWSLPILPPEPVVPQRVPILERKAVVDTSARPVAKKHKSAKAQAATVPAEPSEPESPARKPKQRKHKRQHVERPQVERPERPNVIKPDVTRPEVTKPDVTKPEVVQPDVIRPHRERAERPRS